MKNNVKALSFVIGWLIVFTLNLSLGYAQVQPKTAKEFFISILDKGEQYLKANNIPYQRKDDTINFKYRDFDVTLYSNAVLGYHGNKLDAVFIPDPGSQANGLRELDDPGPAIEKIILSHSHHFVRGNILSDNKRYLITFYTYQDSLMQNQNLTCESGLLVLVPGGYNDYQVISCNQVTQVLQQDINTISMMSMIEQQRHNTSMYILGNIGKRPCYETGYTQPCY